MGLNLEKENVVLILVGWPSARNYPGLSNLFTNPGILNNSYFDSTLVDSAFKSLSELLQIVERD